VQLRADGVTYDVICFVEQNQHFKYALNMYTQLSGAAM
jgi:hypothetical protein